MTGVPPGRRPDKAVLMAELKRLGVEFSSLEHGSALHEKLIAAQGAAKMDPDGDGKPGGSKPRPRKKPAPKG